METSADTKTWAVSTGYDSQAIARCVSVSQDRCRSPVPDKRCQTSEIAPKITCPVNRYTAK